MEVDSQGVGASASGQGGGSSEAVGNRFEVKRWNAVALWAWGKWCLVVEFSIVV